jgi:hypothetical protein
MVEALADSGSARRAERDLPVHAHANLRENKM